ncbi:MAG: hypothetical protein KF856_14445 [Cyclobacteriaceae bacterium]|nr:hypothetical protein [Cyclobacteriaceae bacterium]
MKTVKYIVTILVRELNPVLTFSLIVITVLVIGCSEEIKPSPYTYSQLFSGKNQKTWAFKSIVLWEKGKSDTNLSLISCISDDLYIFYADAEKKYEITNGATKCAADEPDIVLTDTWSFVNGGATLNIVIPFLSDLTLPYIVREVSASNMVLEIFINESNTQSYRMAFQSTSEN